jgi:sulfate transport system ATP-binding protein
MYVELEKINKYFKEFQAARDVSFDIGQGILAALLGPSGSGKTTSRSPPLTPRRAANCAPG